MRMTSHYNIVPGRFGLFNVVDDIGLPVDVGVTSILLEKSEARALIAWLHRELPMRQPARGFLARHGTIGSSRTGDANEWVI